MYAAGRALAIRNQCDLILDVQRFGRERVYKRRYLLAGLPIQGEAQYSGRCTQILDAMDRKRHRAGLPAVGIWHNRLYEMRRADATTPDQRLFMPLQRCNTVLDGYWQSEDYFTDAAEVIRHELTPVGEPTAPLAKDEATLRRVDHAVAVGIRFYSEVVGVAGNTSRIIDLYRQAMRLLYETIPEVTFFVFTDSPDRLADPGCLGVPFLLAGGKASDEDAIGVMSLMRRCRSFLVGHSSFHWWAAWLGSDPRKQVFCLPELGGNRQLYHPRSWIRLAGGNERPVTHVS